MASVSTSWIYNTIPMKYVSPSQKLEGSTKKADIPVINFQDKSDITNQIMKASETMGMFLVINHGISKEKMNKIMKNIEDFFNLPEEKKKYPLEGDTNRSCFTASHKDELVIRTGSRRDGLQLDCSSPFDDERSKFWPRTPKNFKEEMVEHVVAVKDLSSRIMEHLSEGLGLERGYLRGELSAKSSLIINHYPPSSDLEAMLGFKEHVDWNIIAVLQSGLVPGLQLFKDGQWFDIETPPEAFVVLLGSQIEVVSNGKLKGALHRVTTPSESRYSANFSRGPSKDCLVKPAKDILKAQNSPPYYKSIRCHEIAEKLKDVDLKDVDIASYIRKLVMIN